MSEETRQSKHWTAERIGRLIVWLLLLLPFLLLLHQCRLRTDIAVWKFARQYEAAVKHPENTKRIFFRSGIHRGNGDWCGAEVFEVRSYKAEDEKAVVRFYEQAEVPIRVDYSRSVGFYLPDRYKQFYWNKEEQRLLAEAEAKSSDPVYVLTAEVDGPDEVPPFVDFRCM